MFRVISLQTNNNIWANTLRRPQDGIGSAMSIARLAIASTVRERHMPDADRSTPNGALPSAQPNGSPPANDNKQPADKAIHHFADDRWAV